MPFSVIIIYGSRWTNYRANHATILTNSYLCPKKKKQKELLDLICRPLTYARKGTVESVVAKAHLCRTPVSLRMVQPFPTEVCSWMILQKKQFGISSFEGV